MALTCSTLQAVSIDSCRGLGQGGIQTIYVAPITYLSGSVQVSGSTVTKIPFTSGSGDLFVPFNFYYGNGTAKENIKSSQANGSIENDLEVEVDFTRFGQSLQANLMTLATYDVMIIVQDWNGNLNLFGQVNGMTPVQDLEYGRHYGDGQKTKVKFTGKEGSKAP